MRFPFVCVDSDGLVVTFWSSLSRFTGWVLVYTDQVAVFARCLEKGQVVSRSTGSFHPWIDCILVGVEDKAEVNDGRFHFSTKNSTIKK